IYKERNEVLSSDNIRPVLEGMLTSVIDRTVDLYTDENGNINAKGLKDFVDANLLPEDRLSVSDLEGKTADELKEFLGQAAFARYDEKEEEMSPERMREFEKVVLLRAIDTKWMDHIDAMDQLRNGIHLRAYGQTDPLREYEQEGFAMFEEMVAAIREDVTRYAMKAQIRYNLEREEVVKGQAVNPKE